LRWWRWGWAEVEFMEMMYVVMMDVDVMVERLWTWRRWG